MRKGNPRCGPNVASCIYVTSYHADDAADLKIMIASALQLKVARVQSIEFFPAKTMCVLV